MRKNKTISLSGSLSTHSKNGIEVSICKVDSLSWRTGFMFRGFIKLFLFYNGEFPVPPQNMMTFISLNEISPTTQIFFLTNKPIQRTANEEYQYHPLYIILMIKGWHQETLRPYSSMWFWVRSVVQISMSFQALHVTSKQHQWSHFAIHLYFTSKFGNTIGRIGKCKRQKDLDIRGISNFKSELHKLYSWKRTNIWQKQNQIITCAFNSVWFDYCISYHEKVKPCGVPGTAQPPCLLPLVWRKALPPRPSLNSQE